jgi:hypothetical protein
MRLTYTGDRGKLTRLEEAVEKDPRLTSEKKSEIMEHIRKLIALFMELDRDLPPVMPAELLSRRRSRG